MTHRWMTLLGVTGMALLSGISAQTPADPAARIGAALDLYAVGEMADAVDSRPFAGLEIAQILPALDAWIGPDEDARLPADRLRLDPPYPSASPPFNRMAFNGPLVTWACAQLPRTGTVEPWEPWWWLTSVALLQQAGEWGLLRGNNRVRFGGTDRHPWRQAMRAELDRGHLNEARERVGAMPRLRLAEAVTLASDLTDATRRFAFGTGAGPAVYGRFDVIRHLEEAARQVNSGRFNDVERLLEPLLSEPGFDGEVSLRIAQLRLLRRDWPAALRWIDRATGATDDRLLLATADYFRGWIAERTDRQADALRSYRDAYTRFDQSPNLNSLFATQLMLAGERAEAARVLEHSMTDPYNHSWHDLWLMLVSGDARAVGRYSQQMRDAR